MEIFELVFNDQRWILRLNRLKLKENFTLTQFSLLHLKKNLYFQIHRAKTVLILAFLNHFCFFLIISYLFLCSVRPLRHLLGKYCTQLKVIETVLKQLLHNTILWTNSKEELVNRKELKTSFPRKII